MPGGINIYIYIYISTHIQNGAVLFGIENMSEGSLLDKHPRAKVVKFVL